MGLPRNLIFGTFYEKFQIWLKSDKNTGTLYRPYFVKKGGKPQNVSFTAEARRRYRFTND
jgi:hypothetical protein